MGLAVLEKNLKLFLLTHFFIIYNRIKEFYRKNIEQGALMDNEKYYLVPTNFSGL